MKFVGIDLATDPRDCGICVLEDDVTAHVGRGSKTAEHPGWLADYCTGADVVGIDVPFGWPIPFAEALNGYRIGTALDPDRRRYRYRTTDGWVVDWLPQMYAHKSKRKPPTPLSVSTEKLGSTAMVGTVLLSQLADEFWLSPRKSNVSKTVVEVYPAASLWAWCMPHDRYKTGKDARNVRVTIVDELDKLHELRIADEHRARLVASDHSLDALVAALTAREYANGNTFDPPEQVTDDVLRIEGWIRVPKGKIGRLDTNPL